MMRSLNSAVAGLRTHQTKMDVIGNNIANVNTAGFKASRVTFSDIYYQTLTSASTPGARGGTNPTQIGYGSAVATVDILNTQTGATSTDRAFDVYITGEGFLITQDAAGNYLYTRLGNLKLDAAGNIVDSNGNFVLGVVSVDDLNSDGTASTLSRLNIPTDLASKLTNISISTDGHITGVEPGEGMLEDIDLSALSWFIGDVMMNNNDNYTGDVNMSISMQPNSANALSNINWLDSITTAGYGRGYYNGAAAENWAFTLDADGYLRMNDGTTTYRSTEKYQPGKELKFCEWDTTANPQTYVNNVVQFSVATNKNVEAANVSAATVSMDMMVTVSVQQLSGAVVTDSARFNPNTVAGGTAYSLAGFSFNINGGGIDWTNSKYVNGIDQQAIARVKVGEGEVVDIGYLMLAKFPNADGLMQAGSSNFSETANSGSPTYFRAGLDSVGVTKGGMLEMSNVDISQEFTDMITTQRGFQANGRIITVSDEMLQELVNLKR